MRRNNELGNQPSYLISKISFYSMEKWRELRKIDWG